MYVKCGLHWCQEWQYIRFWYWMILAYDASMLRKFRSCNTYLCSNDFYTLPLFMLIIHGYPCMVFSIIIASFVVKGSNPLFSAMNLKCMFVYLLGDAHCHASPLDCWVCYLYVLFCGLTAYIDMGRLSFLYSGRFLFVV